MLKIKNYRLFLVSALITIMQTNGNAQLIAYGAMLPPGKINNVINGKNGSIRLSSFKGKFIILSFWNQSCLSCIKDFPKLDSLQKTFKDDLQIIIVNRENKDSTLRFFEKRKRIKPPHLPMITDGDHLHKLFTKDLTPFHAWFSKSGQLLYITDPGNLTADNIKSLLNGFSLSVKNQTDQQRNDWPLDVNTNIETAHNGKPIYYSMLKPCDGINKRNAERLSDFTEETIQVIKACNSIEQLFKSAYMEFDKYSFSTPMQIIWEVEDSLLLSKNKVFTYELKLPLYQEQNRYIIMQRDLSAYFNLHATVERRKVPTLVLCADGDLSNLLTKGQLPADNLFQSGLRNYIADSIRAMTNQPFSIFSSRIKGWVEYLLGIPFVDKVDLRSNIDIQLSELAIDPFNLAQLQLELKKYNLKIITAEEWVDVLVIKSAPVF